MHKITNFPNWDNSSCLWWCLCDAEKLKKTQNWWIPPKRQSLVAWKSSSQQLCINITLVHLLSVLVTLPFTGKSTHKTPPMGPNFSPQQLPAHHCSLLLRISVQSWSFYHIGRKTQQNNETWGKSTQESKWRHCYKKICRAPERRRDVIQTLRRQENISVLLLLICSSLWEPSWDHSLMLGFKPYNWRYLHFLYFVLTH